MDPEVVTPATAADQPEQDKVGDSNGTQAQTVTPVPSEAPPITPLEQRLVFLRENDKEGLKQALIELLKKNEVELFNKYRPDAQLDLSGANLAKLSLRGIDFTRCDLTRADLSGCDLSGAKFDSAVIERADLSNTTLVNTTFTHAQASNVDFSGVVAAHGADFRGAQLFRADLSKGTFNGASFSYCYLNHAVLSGSKFEGAQFVEAVMHAVFLKEGPSFKGANLYKAKMPQAYGVDVDFTGANLTQVQAMLARFSNSGDQGEGQRSANESGPRTTFKGAYVRGLVHDGFGQRQDFLAEAIQDREPEPGTFKLEQLPTKKVILIDGIPGTNKEIYDEQMAKLNALYGLTSVKRQIVDLLNSVGFQYVRAKDGLGKVDLKLHFIFKGPPGTGKTTVARILIPLLHSMGYLVRGELYEVDKSGLVGRYEGETVAKTSEVCDKSNGAGLLVDEAHLLAQSERELYGPEALSTMLKRMEDRAGNWTVIFTGYDAPIEKLMDSDTGLRRRFTRIVNFPDFSNGECVEIFKRRCEALNFKCSSEFLTCASILLGYSKAKDGITFGNAGTAENIFQAAITRMGTRVKGKYDVPGNKTDLKPEDLPYEDMSTIPVEDFKLEDFTWEYPDHPERGLIKSDQFPATGPFPDLTKESMDKLGSLVRIQQLTKDLEASRVPAQIEEKFAELARQQKAPPTEMDGSEESNLVEASENPVH